jgi:hypothetical protein
MKLRTRLLALEERLGLNRPPPEIDAALVKGDRVIKVCKGGQWYSGEKMTVSGLPNICKVYMGLDLDRI